MPHKPGIPKYCLHKVSGQAIVRIDGRDHYLGLHGTPESRALYDRLVAEWLARGRRPVQPTVEEKKIVTVGAIIVAFWDHAQTYYRKPDGTPTSEIDTLRQLMKPLTALYAGLPAEQFGPKAIKTVRQRMIEMGWCRSHINKQVSRVKSIFRWAAEEEMVSGSVHHSLLAVKGLKKGRCDAPESQPVRPVPQHMIDAVKPFVSKQVWALIQLQLLTGARPGELVKLRPVDIDASSEIWAVKPDDHKTAHHGLPRTIYLGPEAKKAILPFMPPSRPLHAYLFSPKEAEAERLDKQYARRKTPLSCGNRPGTNRRKKPAFVLADHYDVNTYRRAIDRACERAFPVPEELRKKTAPARGRKKHAKRWETWTEWRTRLGEEKWKQLQDWRKAHHWHPHQLRHNAATRIRREKGIDAARAVLGHRCLAITDIYAEIDAALAVETMRKLG